MTRQFHLGGQLITFNEENKILKTIIEQPFVKAGKILSWDDSFGSPGLGFNKAIIQYVVKSKAYLCVHVGQEGRDYWIKNDVLLNFLKKNNTEYKAGGTPVSVIPWSLFTRYPVFSKEITA